MTAEPRAVLCHPRHQPACDQELRDLLAARLLADVLPDLEYALFVGTVRPQHANTSSCPVQVSSEDCTSCGHTVSS